MKTHQTRKILLAVVGGAIATITALATRAGADAPPAMPGEVTVKSAEGARDPVMDPEYRRIATIPPKTMPFPIKRYEINADGSYDLVGATLPASSNAKYAFEKTGEGKYRVAMSGGKAALLWDVDEKDTLLEKAKTDPKIMEAIRKDAPNGGYTPETYLQRFGEKEQYRVSIGRSPYALPSTMPIDDVLKLIVARDPRTQSLVDAAMSDHACSTSSWDGWESRPGTAKKPANVERVGMDVIAGELRATVPPPAPTGLSPEFQRELRTEALRLKQLGTSSQDMMKIINERMAKEKAKKPLALGTKISLRDKVERLGVKHRRQIGDTCEIYSAYHLLDYYMKRGDILPFSFEEFQASAARLQNGSSGMSGNALLVILAQKNPGLKIRVRELLSVGTTQNSYSASGCREIMDRFIQHEIEAGRPVWAGQGDHQIMVVGIKPVPNPSLHEKNIEALDSTGFGDKDKGYSHWSNLEIFRVFTLEFVKQATQRTTLTP